MAPNTPRDYRNLVIYEIFTRNHGPHGTFAEVESDLPRIRSLGVDIAWFMPIHPIGKIERKGSLGSPYSISDYRAVNPEYGTLEDFTRLVRRAHELGLKVMIDVVYNHTAHDSRLVAEHPEWFHQDLSGKPVTTVPEWSDVIDLKHPSPGLDTYLIEALQYWAAHGVDGFRCDVASLLPGSFWVNARQAVETVKPGVVWLAESVHAGFVAARREVGLQAISDSELYQAFDMTYVYDIWPIWQAAVQGRVPVARYLEMLRFQDAIYPNNYIKMRYTENHDQPRIFEFAPTPEQAMAWTAFEAFNKGSFLVYAGLESGATHAPSLFDCDPIQWNGYIYTPFIQKLSAIKKDPAVQEGVFTILESEPVIQASWYNPEGSLYGLFNVSRSERNIPVHLPDNSYDDVLSGNKVEVRNGRMLAPTNAVILRYQGAINLCPFRSDLLDE
jgi:glycosidase